MKKIWAIILSVLMAFSFVACSKDDSKEISAEKKKETKQEQKQNEEKKEPEKENDENALGLKPIEPVDINTTPFDFSASEVSLDLKPIEPVKIDDFEFPEIEAKDFEVNFASNISAADKAKIKNLSEEEIKIIIEKKENFLKDMQSAMKGENINIKIDPVSGELILDASILFAVDDAEISKEGQDFLKKFIPAYASVVCKDKYDGFISELMVEGHTDTQGDYDYNKDLSKKRADNVAKYILSDETYTLGKIDSNWGKVAETPKKYKP